MLPPCSSANLVIQRMYVQSPRLLLVVSNIIQAWKIDCSIQFDVVLWQHYLCVTFSAMELISHMYCSGLDLPGRF